MTKRFGIIYKATNVINGKTYIGQTIYSLEKRVSAHENKAKNPTSHFHKAIKLHGKDKFIWEVICECYSKEDMDEKEVYYINLLNSIDSGYNMTLGGEGTIGRSCSSITRTKISNSKAGKPLSDEHRAKLSAVSIGVGKSNNHVEKVSEAISKHWEITYPNGEVEVIRNLSKFCRVHNLSDRGMWLVANNYRKHHKGFSCRKIRNVEN